MPCGLRLFSNPAEGMDVSSLVFVVFCVSRSFYDELISRSEEPYRACVRLSLCVCPIACDLETSTHRRPKHDLSFDSRKKKQLIY